MSVGFDPSLGIEKERRKLIGEMTVERGPEWEAQYRPGTFGCHELLDRTSLLADQLEKTVLTHPSCFRDPEWYALAAQAVENLRELYQRVGADHL
jgi:hypothetical protein